MTSRAPALETQIPLCEVLAEQLSPEGLRQLLGVVGDQVPAPVWQRALERPLSTVLASQGKAFRARLVAASHTLAGGKPPLDPQVPALVEILHSGSLVIDDIEDDSQSRRGAPTLHVTYGTPVALNAGNWLYFWAFAIVERLPLGEHTRLGILRCMSRAMLACHFGQALDLSVAVDQLARSDVPTVVAAATQLKTGRLMQLAAEVGALAAGAPDASLRALADFGCRLGTGLQMLDDAGGITSPHRRHKGFEDLRLGRLTWPWAWAAERESDVSYARLRDLAREVRCGRTPAERLATRLHDSVGASSRARAHQHLTAALEDLRRGLGPSEPLEIVEQEVERMEHSYD